MKSVSTRLGVSGPSMIASLMLLGGVSAQAQEKSPASVEALLYSTMPSTTAHRPEMAMDRDMESYFRSAYGMSDGDAFIVQLSRPIPINTIKITTGDAIGQFAVIDGNIEISSDGVQYRKAARFDISGIGIADLKGASTQYFRIKLNRGRGMATLVIREIAVDSTEKIYHVQSGPGRAFSDYSKNPELEEWARKAERQMEAFWLDTAAMLYTDGFITPNTVNVVYRTGPRVTPVAATGGGEMTVNTDWCHKHPEDTGLTVHEMAHVVQSISAYNPVWLIEGIADYIRWIKFEPENYKPRINVQTAKYTDSYRTTGTFLAWCELHYDSGLVTKLNNDVRNGTYVAGRFKQYCGKDVDTLWAEFIEAYKADPTHITAKPVAQEDRPRELPKVKPGDTASVPLDMVYDSMGMSDDGTTVRSNGGLDGEGDTYSRQLLGASQTWRNVVFQLKEKGSVNVVVCRGQKVSAPEGNYGSLWLLGTAVEGSQRAQTFTVTYTDGSKEDLVQNMSDWYAPSGFPGEVQAVKMPYRNLGNGAKDQRTFYAYAYGFPINSAKTVQSITLPNNQYVKLLAITLGK